MWIGRVEELTALAAALEAPGPVLVLVRGDTGMGRTALVRRALGTRHRTGWYEATPLAGALQLRLLRAAWLGSGAEPEAGDAPPLPSALVQEREPGVLVLDAAEHLTEPDTVAAAIASAWTAARSQGIPLHLVLVGSRAAVDRLVGSVPSLAAAAAVDVALRPLAPDELAGALPGWSSRDRLRAWAAFGGYPSRLRWLDPSSSLPANVQRAILDPEGPLHREGAAHLARAFQKPERYAGLVRALALGARDWGGLRDATPGFGASSQLAPYVASLDEHGIVRAERSLDARAGSRNRRYHLADPFQGFWHRSVLPRLGALTPRDVRAAWRREVRLELDAWSSRVFPHACRSFLVRRGDRLFQARAREAGGLWGEGYDIPVAATLRNGAIVYGRCVWSGAAGVADAGVLASQVRATRYGFGREARWRVLFVADGADHELMRESARDPLLEVVTLPRVLGA
jgi:hypothetical protein